jgi:3-oxoacyl-[acyl-carrier-protein] synthase-1
MRGVVIDLQIAGVGLYCPVGLTAQTACAAMRAGLSRFEELDYVDQHGELLYGSRVPVIEDSLAHRRCAALLSGALANLLRDVDPQVVACCPSVLATGPHRPRTERALVEVMPNPPVAIVRGGPGADLLALEQAAPLLGADRGARHVLICAADSSINARALHRLRESGRLRSSSNPHGVLPGEAAACVLVERASTGGAIRVVSLGVADEPATLGNDAPLRAEGLSNALRRALEAANCELNDVDWRLANHGDEGFFVKEHSMALARLLAVPKAALPLWQPAEFVGDLGVAAGLTQIIWATQAWARGYAPGRTALCICSDPEGPRTAVLVRH